MVKEEGILTLWRGCGPTLIRAMSMNFGMLASYDEIKERAAAFTGVPDATSTRVM